MRKIFRKALLVLQAEAGFKIQPNSVNLFNWKGKERRRFENQPSLNKTAADSTHILSSVTPLQRHSHTTLLFKCNTWYNVTGFIKQRNRFEYKIKKKTQIKQKI